jgi:hypothetical protein
MPLLVLHAGKESQALQLPVPTLIATRRGTATSCHNLAHLSFNDFPLCKPGTTPCSMHAEQHTRHGPQAWTR